MDAAQLQRTITAVFGGGAVLALLFLALEVRIFSGLPGYPAAALVFLTMIVVPGLLLHEALLGRARTDIIERAALSVAFGLAVLAPSGLLALWANLSLDTFIRTHIAVASVVAAGSVFFAPPRSGAALRSTLRGWGPPTLVLLAFVLIAVGGIISSRYWGGDRLARTFDEWRYMTYVNSYLQRDEIDPLHPVGVGEVPYPRMAINVWVVTQAAVARSADVSADDVVMDDLTPLLAVFALASTYALARGLFRSRSVALIAVAFQLGYALTDVAHDEGVGLNALLRIAEDKMVATYILFPLGLLVGSRFVAEPRLPSFVAFGLLGLALFVVHPQPLLFLAAALAAFAVLRAATERSGRPLLRTGLVALPLAGFIFGDFVVWHALNTSWPALFETRLVWREQFKIVHLPGGLIMGNYHLLLHPLMLGALALAPLVWWRARHSLPHQVLLAAAVGWLPLFFIPPLTTAAAKVASAELTARLPLTAPVAVVWAYAVHHAVRWAWQRRRPAPTFALRAAAPAAAVTLVLAATLLIQEPFFRVDGGKYYTWTSTATIIPGTERSIFLGGKDRLLSSEWRIEPDEQLVFDYLRTHVPPGSVVLAPDDMSLHMPGALWHIRPAFSQAIIGQWRRPDAFGLYYGQLSGPDLEAALRRDRIEYVIVREVSEANAALAGLPAAQLLAGIGPYQIFRIV